MLIKLIDGQASSEEKNLWEEECRQNPALVKEKESFEKMISLLRQPEQIDPSLDFTERVMAKIALPSPAYKWNIFHVLDRSLGHFQGSRFRVQGSRFKANLLSSPGRNYDHGRSHFLHFIQNIGARKAVSWALVFSLIVLAGSGIIWQNLKLRQLAQQVIFLEQQMAYLSHQPIPTRFFFFHTSAQSIHLVGNFNYWQAEENYRLERLGEQGVWSITLTLQPGKYEYMFLVDNQEWLPDPAAVDYQSDGFGRENSVLIVPEQSLT